MAMICPVSGSLVVLTQAAAFPEESEPSTPRVARRVCRAPRRIGEVRSPGKDTVRLAVQLNVLRTVQAESRRAARR